MSRITSIPKVAFGIVMIAIASAATDVQSQQQQQLPNPNQQQGQQQAQTIQVLAIVNGQQITRQHLATECVRRFGEVVLESIINNALISNECRKKGVTISSKDIDNELESRAARFGLSVDRYISLIKQERNVSPEKLRNEVIWTEIALRKLAADQIVVTAEEIAEQMESEFGAKVQVRAIAMDDPQKAQQVLAHARANPHEFGRLAKDHSIDPNSASVRGLLPPIRRNMGDKAFEDAAFALEVGQISDVIQIAEQFIILKCERKFPGGQLPDDQRVLAEQRIAESIRETKLGDAAAALFTQMQETSQVVNVFNNDQLRKQMPGIAATVGGHQIPLQKVYEECIARFGSEVLDSEINRTIIMQQLQKANITVGDADIREEIGRAAVSYGYVLEDGSADIERWVAYVTERDASKAEIYIHDEVWPSVALKKLVQDRVQVTEEDLRKAYEANFGPRVEVLAIVLQDQRTAQKVWQMAKANSTEKYFGELAHQYSVEPASRANFGEVPPIQKHGGRPMLEQEAYRLKPGEISGLVPIGENWVVMFCKGHTTPVVQDFDAVKDELYKDILEKKMRIAMAEEFDRLRSASQIDNFLAGTSQPGAAAVQNARRQGSQGNPMRNK